MRSNFLPGLHLGFWEIVVLVVFGIVIVVIFVLALMDKLPDIGFKWWWQ